MTNGMTRRSFLQRMAVGSLALTADPGQFLNLLKSAPGVWTGPSQAGRQQAILDDDIPTRFFYPEFTQDQLDQAWQTGALVNGFPWGLGDPHTMGGIPQQADVSVDADGSAILNIRQPTAQELADWQADWGTNALITEGEQNRLTMKLAVTAFNGRLPTDAQTVEARITLPERFVTGDPNAGMTGIGWAFWMVPDIPRLTATLTEMDVPAEELKAIVARVNSGALEEDMAEFSLGPSKRELGDPFWTGLLGNLVLTFMAGRKTWTAKYPRIDVMHALYEPLGMPVPFFFQNQTITGWLAQQGEDASQVLQQPLRVKLEIGDQVYDPTRDALVAPMHFNLNDHALTPVETVAFPGLENDKNAVTTPHLSVWQIRTKSGDWVPIPRRFVANLTATNSQTVTGEADHIHLHDLTITRRGAVS